MRVDALDGDRHRVERTQPPPHQRADAQRRHDHDGHPRDGQGRQQGLRRRRDLVEGGADEHESNGLAARPRRQAVQAQRAIRTPCA